MSKTNISIVLIIFISFVLGFYFYPLMPEKMVSHWSFEGNPDGYMPKLWGIFLMPLILILLWLMFLLIPKIDPLRENIAKFKKYYDSFIIAIILFLFYIYILTIVWNMGVYFNMGIVISPAISVLFYFVGVLLEHSKRNWFVGIRTPWTLSSDRVWDKTNKLGAKLFKISGVIFLAAIFIPRYAIFIVIIPAVSISLCTVIYSYIEYKKEQIR